MRKLDLGHCLSFCTHAILVFIAFKLSICSAVLFKLVRPTALHAIGGSRGVTGFATSPSLYKKKEIKKATPNHHPHPPPAKQLYVCLIFLCILASFNVSIPVYIFPTIFLLNPPSWQKSEIAVKQVLGISVGLKFCKFYMWNVLHVHLMVEMLAVGS